MRAVCVGECMVELRPEGEGLYRRGFAGDVYNTAVYMKRAAPELDVQFATVTGADPLSQAMRRAWRERGVGEEFVTVDPDKRPGLYMIETDARGERSFHYWRGESAARTWPQMLAEAMRRGGLAGADAVYLSGISLAIASPEDRRLAFEVLGELRGRVGRVAYDPNLRVALWPTLREAREVLEVMAHLADILLPSRQDLELLLGTGDPETLAQALVSFGVREFALTCEARPALVYDGALERIAPPPVTRVVDTSGAGDAFNGAYLAARLAGRAPADAGRAGLALAAHVVTRPGAVCDPTLSG